MVWWYSYKAVFSSFGNLLGTVRLESGYYLDLPRIVLFLCSYEWENDPGLYRVFPSYALGSSIWHWSVIE
jgi:hypothetical protein